ncbi:MAG: hypothetical protein ABIP94_22840, partial [Planctomycetota bacterium]
TVRAVVRSSNGSLFAGGNSTTAGGTAASNIARWNGSAWVPLGTGANSRVQCSITTNFYFEALQVHDAAVWARLSISCPRFCTCLRRVTVSIAQ